MFYRGVGVVAILWIGGDDNEHDDEKQKPAHPVDVRHDYELGIQPVTQAAARPWSRELFCPGNFLGVGLGRRSRLGSLVNISLKRSDDVSGL